MRYNANIISIGLKMLGLYFYTPLIGHNSYYLLSILNKLTLLKKLQTVLTNSVFLDKKKKQLQLQQKIKPLPKPGIEHGTSCTQSGRVSSVPPSQLRVTIVFKLFNCLDAIGRNVNKQTRICGPRIFNKFTFSVIFNMHG